MSENRIIHILIAKDQKPLASYSENTGDFIEMCENMLSKVEKESSVAINLGNGYSIFYINENDITFLLMANSLFPKATAIGCIESIKKEFQSKFIGRDFNSEQINGLNEDFKDVLQAKFELFNENTEVTSEAIANLKEEMIRMKDEVIEASGLLKQRGDIMDSVSEKAQNLVESSENLRTGAKRVKKAEKKKKVLVCLGISLALLIIIYLIICIVCGSLTFQCGS